MQTTKFFIMKSIVLTLCMCFTCSFIVFSQSNFPSAQLDSISVNALKKLNSDNFNNNLTSSSESFVGGKLFSIFKSIEEVKSFDIISLTQRNGKSTDTLVIGLTPGDSMYVTGSYFNDGPIIVYNDGILVFENAQALINGDIFVWGDHAKMTIKNSNMHFPQAYIYERKMGAVGSAKILIENSTLNYSGLSHDLIITGTSKITWRNINNIGFTTCGLSENAEIEIDSTNQAGEFIMMNQAKASFSRAKTVLIWHHIPENAEITTSFPDGTSIASFELDSSIAGIENIAYSYSISNSTDILWGLMPEPGSVCNISNSQIRAIGVWFKNQPNYQVSGLVNSSQYSSFTAPLNGHSIQLTNSFVRTWSLYMFENALGTVENCILGEIGTFANSKADITNSMIDGSGGYFFSTDQSISTNSFSHLNCDFQSKGNAFAIMAYSGQNWGRCIAKDKSIMIIDQSSISDIPEYYNDALVWYQKLEGSSNLFTDYSNSIVGSAWINKASNYYPLEFGWYKLDYRRNDSEIWLPICDPVYNEVYSSELCQWNTSGLQAGSYVIRLTTFDNTIDSNMVEGMKVYNLSPYNSVSETQNNSQFIIYPNPTKSQFSIESNSSLNIAELFMYDLFGRLVWYKKPNNNILSNRIMVDFENHHNGIYYLKIKDNSENFTTKKVVYQ